MTFSGSVMSGQFADRGITRPEISEYNNGSDALIIIYIYVFVAKKAGNDLSICRIHKCLELLIRAHWTSSTDRRRNGPAYSRRIRPTIIHI